MPRVTETRAVRPVFLLVFVVALAIPIVFYARRYFMRYDRFHPPDNQQTRTTALVEVAPSPLPTELPLVGSTTPGADGYPLAHVDEPALRSLFWHRKFDELTRDLERFQDDFENDPRKEYWPDDAATAFATAEPALATKLDDWVAASPRSFAPYLARASYELEVGSAKRGAKYVTETPEADLRAMTATFQKAQADVRRAIELRPKLVSAMTIAIRIAGYLGDAAERKRMIDAATSACSSCFIPRTAYIQMLRPRWGGSYDAMDTFARSASVADNPRLRLLAGYADADRANIARIDDKDFAKASSAIEKAIALGDNWVFLLERGRLREARKDAAGALADFDHASAIRPGAPAIAFERAWALQTLKRHEDAAHALLDGLRVEATDATARELFPYVVANLDYDGWQAYKQGRRADALRIYDIAAELAPTDHELMQRRAWIIVGSDNPDLQALQAAVAKSPDDLRLHQQLDYSLAQKRRFSEVVVMWTEYIGRHPDDAVAYRERGGAYWQLHDTTKARADAAKACDLGDNEGCAHR